MAVRAPRALGSRAQVAVDHSGPNPTCMHICIYTRTYRKLDMRQSVKYDLVSEIMFWVMVYV